MEGCKLGKKIIIILISIVVLILTFLFYIVFNFKNTAKAIHHPIEVKMNEVELKSDENIKNEKKILKTKTFLIIGVDERPKDKGRADVVIIIQIDTETNEMKILNIPRDTLVNIEEKGSEDKINHSYAYGDIQGVVNTVEGFLETKVDHYVKMNMEGFVEIVDVFGGIEVNNQFYFEEQGIIFKKGKNKLNGKEALVYVRMRSQDAEGDIGRNKRQQEVLKQIMAKTKDFEMIYRWKKLFGVIEEIIKTNISAEELMNVLHYKKASDNILILKMNGENLRINNKWYYVVAEEERKKIISSLK